MTRNSLAKTFTNLCCPINKKYLIPQNYATRRMNYPDNQSKDVLALSNNPFYKDSNTGQIKRHIEISRLECSLLDCKQKDCPVLCATCISVKSIASATHGNPKISAGDVYVLDDDMDINGDKKPQNAVAFKKPHDTGLASEYKKGTDFINKGENGAKRRKKIMDNENDH